MQHTASRIPAWALFGGSVLLSWAILGVGFRLLYDSVIPEVAALVSAGFALALFNKPKLAWVWLLGLSAGIWISERAFPVSAPAEHVAQYGPPQHGGVGGLLLICAFPLVGTMLGLAARRIVTWAS
jgi:hypothetical protein